MGECCWKKNAKGHVASTNLLEVPVDEEKATLAEINMLCKVKNNVFFGTKVPRRNQVVTFFKPNGITFHLKSPNLVIT